jgi:CubicO group peptidase (beta-lactamase class C family)
MPNPLLFKENTAFRVFFLFSIAVITSSVCCNYFIQKQAPDFRNLEQSVSTEIAKYNIPGASIAIIRGEKIVYSKAFGTANIETGEPTRPEMLFRLGSTTKMFTAAAVTGLAVEGKIDLNEPIGSYLKFLPQKVSAVTTNQLLSHTAGICDRSPMYGSHDDAGLGIGIRGWTDDWMVTSPGTTFSYSSPGYWLAGYLLETVTSKPYADAMEKRLFKPLGMTHTTLRPTMAMTWPLAQGHEIIDGKVKIARPAADNSATWPAGSIFSNTHDLAQFVIAFMNEGRLEGKQVLDPNVITLMSTSHVIIPGEAESGYAYCYGLSTRIYRGYKILEHSGARIGYGSDIRVIPEEHVAVIVLTNRTDGSLPETIEKAIELFVPLSSKTAAMKKLTVMPISSQDDARMVGGYRNGDQQIEIAIHDNRLFVKDGVHPETELFKRSEGVFAVGNTDIEIISGAAARMDYVLMAGRAFSRKHLAP